jgi:DNA mismatch repair protein MutL
MGNIIKIPQKLKEKIAAGEVITSPFSVVKELIENAIDAGSTDIKIKIESGGKRLIKVTDNGKGMDKEDLELCAKRYTTSKIHTEEEFINVKTLGFRGEALASITVVSELKISSNGIEMWYDEEGGIIENKPSSLQKGTSIEVRNLFSKFPARLKFLKSDEIEFSKIYDLVQKYSLVYENVSFTLLKEEKVMFNSPIGDMKNKAYYAYGKEIADNLIEIKNEKIHGLISKASYTRKTSDYQTVFINGRLIKHKTIPKIIEDSYPGKFFLDRSAVVILNLNVEPHEIDVNIHPSKDEIMFKHEKELYDFIRNSVAETLNKTTHEIITDAETNKLEIRKKYEMDKGMQQTFNEYYVENEISEEENKESENEKYFFRGINVLGQANRTYIVGTMEDGLILIDQHAAQERVLYEKFKKKITIQNIERNELIKPLVFTLNDKEIVEFEKIKDKFDSYGFNIEMFGKNQYILRTIPSLFGKNIQPDIIKDVLDDLLESRKTQIEDSLEDKIARKACRAAIKGGDIVSVPEMRKLLYDLDFCDFPFTCPHGRPTMIKITWRDFEKKFKRED